MRESEGEGGKDRGGRREERAKSGWGEKVSK